MAKIQTAKAKRTFDELSAFTNQQSVIVCATVCTRIIVVVIG